MESSRLIEAVSLRSSSDGSAGRALSRLWAHIEIARPAEVAVIVAGTLAGSRVIGVPASVETLTLAGSNGLLFAGCLMLNDWRDIVEDSINKPHRPIPSGRVERDHALLLGALAYAAGIAGAAALGLLFGLLACAVALLSVAYALKLKRVPWAGNLVSALLMAYPVWCWLPRFPSRELLAIVAGCLLFRLGAEIVKTAEDVAGDAAAGIRTVATLHGTAAANRIGTGLICAAIPLSWLPCLWGEIGPAFFVALPVTAVLGFLSCRLAFQGETAEASRSLVALERAIMTVTVVALFLS